MNKEARLLQVIEKETGQVATLNDEIRDVALDSLDFWSCIITIEDEFNVEIPDINIDSFKQVRDILPFLEG